METNQPTIGRGVTLVGVVRESTAGPTERR
jgi:hypothetical protein